MNDSLFASLGVLSGAKIRELLENDPPLASGLEDAAVQVQPNGLDVRLESVWSPENAGRLGRAQRAIPRRHELPFDGVGWLKLPHGSYVIRFCENVHLPLDVMALGFPRSSLLRSGCSLLTAVWDAGYQGRSEALLTVLNPAGFQIQSGSRIAQLVFFRLARPTEGYKGIYQGENQVTRGSTRAFPTPPSNPDPLPRWGEQLC